MEKVNHGKCIFLSKLDTDATSPTYFANRIQIKIDGSKIADAKDLMSVLSLAMGFPAYFGWNWDALEECLADLEWLPADIYDFEWSAASTLLASSPYDFFMFLEVFASVSREWHEKGKSFRLFVKDDYIFANAKSMEISVAFVE